MNGRIRTLLVLAALAVAVRLFALTFLHPLNWDEIEYFRASDWVRQGLVPFRDFWEHHTPLQWFVFAPVTALTKSTGAGAVILMRWAQVPLWALAFWLVNRLMQRAGMETLARWTSIVLALSSSLLMISAVEFRVDILGIVLYLGGVLLMIGAPLPAEPSPPPVAGEKVAEGRMRGSSVRVRTLGAGALFCLAGLANLRLGPLLAVTVILSAVVDVDERRWGRSRKGLWLFAGVMAVGAVALLYFIATDSLVPLYQHVWVENYIGEKYAERVPLAFLHRILVAFGVRLYGGDVFQWTGIDLGGVAIIVLGVAGLVRALREWRRPDTLFLFALLQIANVFFIATMKFVYHYHLQIVVLLMIPFVATAISQVGSVNVRRAVLAFVVIASIVNVPIVLLRGKELELQYQDRIMREVHARTSADAKVFDGVGWAIRRQPAYRFWFLPVLARQLVSHQHAPPYSLTSWMADPPAAVITDRNAVVWLAMHRDLGSYVVRHYLPLWRNLLLPGLSARIDPGETFEWVAPANGRYRIVAAPDLADHAWFRFPFAHRPEAVRSLSVQPRGGERLRWKLDGQALSGGAVLDVRRGSRVEATSIAAEPLGVFLVSGEEPVWFRQPPPNVTIDAEGPREWHLPRLSRGGCALSRLRERVARSAG